MLQAKNFIIQFNSFFRFNKAGFPCVAFTMKNAFYLALMFGKKSNHTSSVQKCFSSVGNQS